MDAVDSDGKPTSILTFGVDGLAGFLEGIDRARLLADRLQVELDG
jgi:hypothetical protein